MLTFNKWRKQVNKTDSVEYFRVWNYNEKYFEKGVEVLQGESLPFQKNTLKRAMVGNNRDYTFVYNGEPNA